MLSARAVLCLTLLASGLGFAQAPGTTAPPLVPATGQPEAPPPPGEIITSKSNVLFSHSAPSTRSVLSFIRSFLAAASLLALASSAWGSRLVGTVQRPASRRHPSPGWTPADNRVDSWPFPAHEFNGIQQGTALALLENMNPTYPINRSSLALPVLSFMAGGITLILGAGAGVFWLSYYFVFFGLVLGVLNVAACIGTVFVGASAYKAAGRGRSLAIAGMVMALISLLPNFLCFGSLWFRSSE
jgi:hypothetical protein